MAGAKPAILVRYDGQLVSDRKAGGPGWVESKVPAGFGMAITDIFAG